MCAAAGAVGGAAYRAISPSKRLRGPPEGESAPPPHSVPDECDDGEEEVAGGEKSADGRGRKGGERGKVSDRWITRCTKEAITGDLATGCGCPSGCTDHMSVDLVMTERKEVAKLDGDERRTDLRTYLDGNVNTSTTLGFNLHPLSDSDRRLCANAFDSGRPKRLGLLFNFSHARVWVRLHIQVHTSCPRWSWAGRFGRRRCARSIRGRFARIDRKYQLHSPSLHRPCMQGPASSLHAGTK